MSLPNKKQHFIDFLFPLVLFFLFTLLALTILLFAAHTYQSSTEDAARNNEARTSLAYIVEKIHQNDQAEAIRLESLDGCEALLLTQTYQQETYDTYLYVYEGTLRELFIKRGANATASDGTGILSLESISIEPLSTKRLQIRCTDANGNTASMIVGLQSPQTIS